MYDCWELHKGLPPFVLTLMTQNLNTTPIDPKFYSGSLADRHDPSKCPLFQPLKIGNVELSHRIVLAPLTRFRADSTHVHREVL